MIQSFPLHAAAETGDLDSLARLIQSDIAVNSRDERGRTPLMAATHGNQPEAFRMLLEAGADVDLQDDLQDNPFLYAGAEGLLEILVLANDSPRSDGVLALPARLARRHGAALAALHAVEPLRSGAFISAEAASS